MEYEALVARNDEKMGELAAGGVSFGNSANEHYFMLLLEALAGEAKSQRCREETALWLAERLDEVEAKIAKMRREAVLLNGNT